MQIVSDIAEFMNNAGNCNEYNIKLLITIHGLLELVLKTLNECMFSSVASES